MFGKPSEYDALDQLVGVLIDIERRRQCLAQRRGPKLGPVGRSRHLV